MGDRLGVDTIHSDQTWPKNEVINQTNELKHCLGAPHIYEEIMRVLKFIPYVQEWNT